MSKDIQKVNQYFKTALKTDVDSVKGKIVLSDRQEKVFDMFYLKKQDIGFIADSLYVSVSVINSELRLIRTKVLKVI